jgi:plastocyanin
VGQSVTWHFDDAGVPHTVTAGDGSFDSPVMTSGTFTHRFDKAGSYDYICTIHPTQMKGTIVVG